MKKNFHVFLKIHYGIFLVLLVLYLALGAGLFYAANRIIDNYKLTFDFSALMTVFISLLVVIFILMFVVYFFLTTWLLIRNKTRVKKFNKKHNQKLLNYKTIANDQKITSIQKFWKIVLYFQKHFSIELITWLAYSDATLLFVLLNNYQWWIKFIFILAATSSVFITIFLRRNTFYLKYKDPKIIVNGKVQPKNKTKK